MEALEKSEILSQVLMNPEFCEKHLFLSEKSGLSLKKYCKVNNIHYTRFLYWVKKASLGRASTADGSIPLIAVKLKNKNGSLSEEAICTLSFKNGCFLKIYTTEALSCILERMG